MRLYDSAYQQLSVDVGSGGTIRNTGTVEAATINLQAADGNISADADGLRRRRKGHIETVCSESVHDAGDVSH